MFNQPAYFGIYEYPTRDAVRASMPCADIVVRIYGGWLAFKDFNDYKAWRASR